MKTVSQLLVFALATSACHPESPSVSGQPLLGALDLFNDVKVGSICSRWAAREAGRISCELGPPGGWVRIDTPRCASWIWSVTIHARDIRGVFDVFDTIAPLFPNGLPPQLRSGIETGVPILALERRRGVLEAPPGIDGHWEIMTDSTASLNAAGDHPRGYWLGWRLSAYPCIKTSAEPAKDSADSSSKEAI